MPVKDLQRPARTRSRKKLSASMDYAMEAFLDEALSRFSTSEFESRKNALILLREFLDCYGAILLQNKDINVSVRVLGRAGSKNTVCRKCSPAQVIDLFRNCIDYFLWYKVNMPQDSRDEMTSCIKEFADWLVARGFLESVPDELFAPCSRQLRARGLAVIQLLWNFIRHSSKAGSLDDLRSAEPSYMISRVRTGKLWFIGFVEDGYEEIGPVRVPAGVTDLVRPGWSFECAFEMRNGCWRMSEIKDLVPAVLPV